MVDPDRNDGAPSHIHIEEKKKFNWLPWLLLLAGLLALIWFLTRDRDQAQPVTTTTTTETTAAATAAAPTAAVSTESTGTATIAGASAIGGYLAGTEATPRTFQFERLNFDTASAAIRPQDASEVQEIAAALKQYPNARVRIVGYTDPRGGADMNAQLGQQRADAVRAALVGQGIAETRIETASGGETDPVAANATAGGMAENRRTEIIVLSR